MNTPNFPVNNVTIVRQFWGFHCGEYSSRRPLGFDAV